MKDVLLFQWPDHKPLPPALTPHDRGKGVSRPPPQHFLNKSKGKGKGKPQTKQAFVTEANEAEDEGPEIEDDGVDDTADYQDENEHEDEEPPEQEDGDDENWEDPEVQQILSVTARKLAGVLQARKYGNSSTSSSAPRRSIADRKRTTHCSACGQQGHWAGDPECSVSNKGKSAKGTGKSDNKGGKNPKAVHFLNHYGGHDDEEPDDNHHVSHTVYVSHLVPSHQVHLLDATKAAGHIILDTACQRLCAGRGWFEAQKNKLLSWDVTPIELPTSEFFEFGKGTPIESTFSMYYPIQLGEYICILAPCILEATIPCLASRTWLQEVGAVIDLSNQSVYFHVFEVTVPLVLVNGHLGLDMSHRRRQQDCFDFWNAHQREIHDECSQGHVREFISYPLSHQAQVTAQASPPQSGWSPAADAPRSTSTASVAMALALPGQEGGGLGKTGPPVPPTASTLGGDTIGRCEDQGQGHEGQVQAGDHLSGDHGLRAPARQEVRESARKLCSVPGLQDQVEVEPHSPRLGTLHRGLQFLTIATAFLGHCLGSVMDGQPNRLQEHERPAAAATFDAGYPSYNLDEIFGKDLRPTAQGQGGPATTECLGFGSRPPEETRSSFKTDTSSGHLSPGPRGAAGERPGALGRGGTGSRRSTTSSGMEPGMGRHDRPDAGATSLGGERRRLRLGELRRLTGVLNRSADILAVEQKIYEALPTAQNVPKIDIMELYAGFADISFLAHQYDLHALEPFDLLYNKDMTRRRDKLAWRRARKEHRPLLVVVETECTEWNIFNENLNYLGKNRMDELEAKRELQYPLVKEGVHACYDQINDGNLFLFENPAA